MTLVKLLDSGEFWSALFGALAGALAAFLLGALGKRWVANSAKRAAGNLTLITLSQMYSLLENLRRKLFDEEFKRQANLLRRPPLPFELRAAVGLDDRGIRLPIEQLGFLVDSGDADVLNRLLTVERAYGTMIILVRRHVDLHAKLQDRMAEIDATGTMEITPENLAELVGVHVIMQLTDTVSGLSEGLPKTRDALLSIGSQLRGVLRMQLPARRFIRFEAAPGTDRRVDELPGLMPPTLWRRAVRKLADSCRRWHPNSPPKPEDAPR